MTPELPAWMIFAYGACIGSFLNVCAYRIPAGLSIVTPPSRCPSCGSPVRWYDNIPILSWTMLVGSCRNCSSAISVRYTLVEAFSGLMAAGLYQRFGFSPEALVYFCFGAVLLTLSLIDWDHRILPNTITLPGIPIFFAASWLLPAMTPAGALLGMVTGGGSLWLVAVLYRRLRGGEGMGMGDVKLLAMIGALLGAEGVLFTILAASLMGTAAGLVSALRRGEGLRHAIPFGPCLSLAAMLYVFRGPELIGWYQLFLLR